MNPLRAILTTTVVAALAGATSDARAQGMQASLPAYQPAQKVAGVIRTWGHGSRDKDYIGSLVSSWGKGFQKHQPAVGFEARLRGDKSAIGGLYTGAADIALMERDLSAIEKDSYEQLFGRTDPFEVSVATGSLDARNHGMALVIFVHKDNPLAKLTLAQLDAIFGADHRRGLNNIRTWGELGLTGEWAAKPIHAYGFGIEQDQSQYFQKAVMGGSQKWTGKLKEFDDLRKADGTVAEAGRRIVDAVSHDRQGIAISQMAYQNSQVKPLALAAEGPYYEPSRETVAQRKYPLAQQVKLYINRAPGQPIDPKVKEYLRYILSQEGQEDIARDGGYFPLSPELAAQERRKLE
jgi:phosphate transport system substrate-binding protein